MESHDETLKPLRNTATSGVSQKKQSDELNQEFISMLMHEIRNPLHTIAMASEMLMESSDPRASQYPRRIKKSAERMARLLRQVSDFLQLEKTGSLGITPELHEFSSILKQVAADLLLEFPKATIAVAAPDQLQVKWDRDRMTDVFWSLIRSAIHCDHEGKINMSMRAEGNDVVIEATNTSASADKKTLPLVWTPADLRQTYVHAPVHRLGMALYISRAAVAEHGGTLDIDEDPSGLLTLRARVPKEPFLDGKSRRE